MVQQLQPIQCCRLCLAQSGPFRSVFEASNERTLQQKIKATVAIEVIRTDRWTTVVCIACINKISEWHAFKVLCTENQSKLERMLHSENSLDLGIHVKDEPIDVDSESLPNGTVSDTSTNTESQTAVKLEPNNDSTASDSNELQPPTLTPYNHVDEDISNADVSDDLAEDVPDIPADNSTLDSSKKLVKNSSKRCSTCRKTFSTPNNRVRHEKLFHGENSKKNVSSRLSQRFKKAIETTGDSNNSDDKGASEKDKIEFAAGLKLLQNNDPSFEPLTKIENSYTEKCKAMILMLKTLVCACHNLQQNSLKRLFSHLRSVKSWFPIFTCYNCMITFTDRSTHTRHYGRCPNEKIYGLDKLANMKHRSETKIRLYHNFRCSQCNFIFSFYEEFCQHIQNHIDVDEDGEPKLPTECACGRAFDSVESFQRHAFNGCFVTHHCDICATTYDTLDEFKNHCVSEHDEAEGFSIVADETDGTDNGTKTIPTRSSTGSTSSKRPTTPPQDVIVYGKRKRSSTQFHQYVRDDESENDSKTNVPTVPCPECSKLYCTFNSMQRHFRQQHPEKEGPRKSTDAAILKTRPSLLPAQYEASLYCCPDCGDMFSSSDWQKHKESHAKKKCTECSKVFQFQSELDQHRSVHLNLKVYKDSKTQSYKIHDRQGTDNGSTPPPHLERSVPFGKHNAPSSDDYYPCNMCDKEYNTYKGLWSHNRKYHPNNRVPPRFPKVCPICEKTFTRGISFALHMRVHNRDGHNVSLQQLQQPQQEQTSNYDEDCDREPALRKFQQRSKQFLNDDLEQEEDDDANTESYHTCKRCFKVFSSKSTLRSHMRSHGMYLAPVKNETLLTCDLCSHRPTFNTQAALKRHKELKHLSRRLMQQVYCKYCKIAFPSAEELNQHMREEHGELRVQAKEEPQSKGEVKCHICGKDFKSTFALNCHAVWHRKGLLNGDKARKQSQSTSIPARQPPVPQSQPKYRCNSCGMILPNSTALQIHVLEKHRNVNATIMPRCHTCNMDFESMAEYEQHRRFHDSVASKKQLQCQFCPATYSRLENLSAHVKQHHTKAEFHCNYCDRVFDKQSSFAIHLKVHEKHREKQGAPTSTTTAMNMNSTSVSAFPQAIASQNGARMFACSICNMGFDVPKELRQHTFEMHPF